MEEREGEKRKRKKSRASEKLLAEEAEEAAQLESFLFGKSENEVASEDGHDIDESDNDEKVNKDTSSGDVPELAMVSRSANRSVEGKKENRKRKKAKISKKSLLEAEETTQLESLLLGKSEIEMASEGGRDSDESDFDEKENKDMRGGDVPELAVVSRAANGTVEGEKEKRKRKKPKVSEKLIAKEAEEAAELESFLFGKSENELGSEFGHEIDESDNDEKENKDTRSGDVPQLAVVSRAGNGTVAEAGVGKEGDGEEGKKPVWVDEEEARAVVKVSGINRLRKLRKEEGEEVVSGKDYISRLRAQHTLLNRGVSWAELPSDRKGRRLEAELGSDSDSEGGGQTGEDDGANEEARQAEGLGGIQTLLENSDLVVKSRSRLPQGLIEITPMRDGNSAEPCNAVIQSVEFHRNAQILMTAGFDKRLRFFQIDGKRNPKVQSIFLEDFPVHKAAFVPDGSKVIAAGRRNFYFMYDLEAGRVERISPLVGRTEKSLENFEVSPDNKHVAFLGNDGYILLCSLGTKQWVGNLKMNGSVRSVAFAENGQHLISTGGDGEIYHWDLRTRRCFHRGTDEGCVKSTSLGISSDSRLFATGSGSGVVNVYNREGFIGGVTRPIKSLMNLVTTVDNVKFNSDSQILAITSRMKKNALRLVHLPSYTVFSNWPTLQTPLHYVHSLDFSPGGGYLAVGNAAGRVLLYRLRHYDHA